MPKSAVLRSREYLIGARGCPFVSSRLAKAAERKAAHGEAPTVKVVAKAPEFDHGDIENNPMPPPAVNGNNLIAKTANAALATAETDDSVGASKGEDFQAPS
jgi:hypothetical protein